MIDLHMHSRYSEDGEFTPAELVEQCYRQGITTMSIGMQSVPFDLEERGPDLRRGPPYRNFSYRP